jgi:hypothetical protein
MKKIEFKDTATQRVYDSYMNRCNRVVGILSDADREDCLLEVNSYIYEYTQNNQDVGEMTSLLNILERMGDPEVTLKEVVAAKKIDQAVKSYKIKDLFQALILNLKNGVVYIILFCMSLLLVTFPILIVMELIYPKETGLHISDKSFFFGYNSHNSEATEFLGNWFVPVVITMAVAFYFSIIFFLKLIKNKKS